MKKLSKILSAIMVMVILASVSTSVMAINLENLNSQATLNNNVTGKMETIGSTVLTIITNAGMILAIVIIAVIGIKYMMQSSEGKAEYKKNMIPFLVGAVLVFGASAIGKMIIGFGQSIV